MTGRWPGWRVAGSVGLFRELPYSRSSLLALLSVVEGVCEAGDAAYAVEELRDGQVDDALKPHCPGEQGSGLELEAAAI